MSFSGRSQFKTRRLLAGDEGGADRDGDDFAFWHRPVAEAGVAAAPISNVCAERAMTSLIRLCLTKRLPLLHERWSGSPIGGTTTEDPDDKLNKL
ncbi:hypothetical protein [Azospirillum argentinense]